MNDRQYEIQVNKLLDHMGSGASRAELLAALMDVLFHVDKRRNNSDIDRKFADEIVFIITAAWIEVNGTWSL